MASDVKWIQLDVEFFNNKKIKALRKMPSGSDLIVIWFELLALAGQINDEGFIYFSHDIPYTDELLSAQFDFPPATIQLALMTFQRFGMIEIQNEIIKVSNWAKYQNEYGLKKIREKNRDRQRRFRENQKALPESQDVQECNVMRNVTRNVTVTLSPSYSLSMCDDNHTLSSWNEERGAGEEESNPSKFDIFWEAYGYKKGKKNAQKAFAKIDPDDALFQKIIAGVEAYHQSRNWKEGYRKEPTTWLNGECWEDDYSNEKAPEKGNQKTVSAQNYEQRNYTEEELLSVSDDLIEEARSRALCRILPGEREA